MIHKASNKKYLTLEELKTVEIDLLYRFASYCDNNNLCYCLCGGTLLGAIRHKGFIPWDDDIDVMMPRKDYNQFIEKQHEDKRFDYCTAVDGTGNLPILKLLDKNIHVEVPYSEGEQVSFAWIDVFPIDGMEIDDRKARRRLQKIWFLKRLSNAARAKCGSGTTPFRSVIKMFLALPAKLLGAQKIAEMIDRISSEISFEEADYVGGLTWGYGMKEKMPKKEWVKRVHVTFEGREYWAPGCWNYYLTSLYGDYMKLPPDNERHHHSMKAWVEDL